MRVLVCGSRSWNDRIIIDAVLTGLDVEQARHFGPAYTTETVLIHGDANGADRIAKEWGHHHLPAGCVEDYPAEWDRYGKRAGFVRNQQMLDEGKPTVVIAFRSEGESKGTDMMVDLAKKAGVPVYVVTKP